MEQWIIEVVTAFGYVGVFFLMLAENLFPPIPSEVIVPVAGLAVGAGPSASGSSSPPSPAP